MTVVIPFTPPHVSINRVQIVDLPGLPVDEEVRGQKAYHLLSNLAIINYARQLAPALDLPPAYLQDTPQTRRELPRFVDSCLNSPNAGARAAAETIARRLGRNLGHILLTLHRGDAVNRQARPDWSADDWDKWGRVERVWLGGGLMSGQLGELIARHARACLAQMGYADKPSVELSPFRQAMTILGAGRCLPASARHALCLDYGQTSVKRACLNLEEGTLVGASHYPSLAVEWDIDNLPIAPTLEMGQRVLAFMADALAQTWNESVAGSVIPGDDVMLCVAAYVRDGQLLGNGLYATLMLLGEDARALLSDALWTQSGCRVRVHLIHDGTAAAALHAGQPASAVFVIGTAIGVGFPPLEASGLRPLSPVLRQNIL